MALLDPALKIFVPEKKPRTTSAGKLTERGAELKESLFKAITDQKFPKGLTSRFIGDALREDILQRRSLRKGLSSVGAETDVLRSPLIPALKGSTQNVRLAGRGVGRGFEAERGFESNRLSNLQGFLDIELGGAALPAQADFIKQLAKSGTQARRGAFVGNVARLAAGFF